MNKWIVLILIAFLAYPILGQAITAQEIEVASQNDQTVFQCVFDQAIYSGKVCLDDACDYWVVGNGNKGDIFSNHSTDKIGFYSSDLYYSTAAFFDIKSDKEAAIFFLQKACIENTEYVISLLNSNENFSYAMIPKAWDVQLFLHNSEKLGADSCKYLSPVESNNWVIVYEKTHDYCNLLSPGKSSGASPVLLSLSLLANPGSINNTNYLFVLIPLLLVLGFIFLWRNLKNKNQIATFFRPNPLKIIVSLAVGIGYLYLLTFDIFTSLFLVAFSYVLIQIILNKIREMNPIDLKKLDFIKIVVLLVRHILGIGIALFGLAFAVVFLGFVVNDLHYAFSLGLDYRIILDGIHFLGSALIVFAGGLTTTIFDGILLRRKVVLGPWMRAGIIVALIVIGFAFVALPDPFIVY
jgi:hypothetical protein